MLKIENLVAAALDIHVWVWAAAGDARADRFSGFAGMAMISAISMWEVSMLAMKGRLELLPDEESWFAANLMSPVSLAPITSEISTTSCRLPEFHGDPADRLIVATAIILGLPLITADEKIIRWNKTQRAVQLIAL